MTIYDISKLAGVSIATVSRVLNGSPNVRPVTKDKVLGVMAQHGYTPNAFARGLGLNTMRTIGILCADSSDLYLAKAVYHMERRLREKGYSSVLCCTGYDFADKESASRLLLAQKVDACILVGSNFVSESDTDNRYIRDAASQLPVMLLNAAYDYPNVYCALCDDTEAVQNVTCRLLDCGIKDILFFYDSTSYSGQKKRAGYREGYLSRNLPLREEYQQYFPGSHDDVKGMEDFLEGLFQKGITFHAVVASDDILATAALKFAGRHSLCLPQDFSVVGYNNSLLAACCEPELTSVDNRLEDLCSILVHTLANVLGGQDMPQKVVLTGKLVTRKTTVF